MLRPTHTKLYATLYTLEIVDVEAHTYQTIRYALYPRNR